VKVVLFIGHHKVGSSSLQDYLARNASRLAKAGILYPFVDFEGMSFLAASAFGKGVPEGRLPFNVNAPHNALAFAMMAASNGRRVPTWHKMLPSIPQMIFAVRQQVRQLQPHTVILASEVFSNFAVRSPESVKQIADLFPDAEITVVASLRRIDDYLISWHGQRITFGEKVAPLRGDVAISNYMKGIHFDYWRMLKIWLDHFPGAEFILQNYSDVMKTGGAVNSFFQATKINRPAGMLPEIRDNVSIHRGIFEFSRLANNQLSGDVAPSVREHLQALVPNMDLPASKEIELIGAETREKIYRNFAPINEKLGGVVGRTVFFEDLEAVLQEQPVPEQVALDSVITFLESRRGAAMTANYRSEFERLIARTRELWSVKA